MLSVIKEFLGITWTLIGMGIMSLIAYLVTSDAFFFLLLGMCIGAFSTFFIMYVLTFKEGY